MDQIRCDESAVTMSSTVWVHILYLTIDVSSHYSSSSLRLLPLNVRDHVGTLQRPVFQPGFAALAIPERNILQNMAR
jgi:hypothetical protein